MSDSNVPNEKAKSTRQKVDRATTATVNFGLFQAACLKTGEAHAVSSSQMVALTLISRSHATRDLKTLLGADSCLSNRHNWHISFDRLGNA